MKNILDSTVNPKSDLHLSQKYGFKIIVYVLLQLGKNLPHVSFPSFIFCWTFTEWFYLSSSAIGSVIWFLHDQSTGCA